MNAAGIENRSPAVLVSAPQKIDTDNTNMAEGMCLGILAITAPHGKHEKAKS